MRAIGLTVAVCLSVVMLGCGPMVEVKQDFDDRADFESFKTYDWTAEAVAEAEKWEEGGRNLGYYITRAVDQQLPDRGVRRVSSEPDLLVTFWVALRGRSGETTWGLDAVEQIRNYEAYRSGGAILVIEFLDAQTNDVVWRGGGHGAVNIDPSPEIVEANVNRAIKKILAQYPPKAK